MLFYNCVFSHNGNFKLSIDPGYTPGGKVDETVKAFYTIHSRFFKRSKFKNTFCAVYDVSPDEFMLVVGVWQKSYCVQEVCDFYMNVAGEVTESFEIQLKSYTEITFKEALNYWEIAAENDYCNSTREDYYKLSVYDTRDYALEEECFEKRVYDLPEAREMADEILGSSSLFEELDRIYSEGNMKEFYGCPVHYRIQSGSKDAALSMIRVLAKALYSNDRLLSTRICVMSDFDGENMSWRHRCVSEIENLGFHSEGGCVVINTIGNEDSDQYASLSENTLAVIRKFISQYGENVQIFLIEDEVNPGFSKRLFEEMIGEADFVKVSEGVGDKAQAKKYMEKLARESKYKDLFGEDAYRYLPDRKYLTSGMVSSAFNKWSDEVLKKKVYSSYSKIGISTMKKKSRENNKAYEELMEMVGLDEVKQVVHQIISSYKLSKYKSSYGMSDSESCRHMVFTGNPGCAKTTVARLLCDILRKEEVLKTGNFVECGRADLVGRYVGWTAKAVKARFREAKGGILFIDEAYSLVDDSNSFGAEAINTIVQEMENARDEVIVIFAGYPEPMERFIEQNEGMRSRIAFHLKFPDYNPDELMGIMDLMLKKKELEIDLPARSECRKIFELACDMPDFGNGRFARNLLEQAIMKQAERLLPPGIRKRPSKSEIKLLKKEDFQVNISQMLKNETKLEIGFVSNF